MTGERHHNPDEWSIDRANFKYASWELSTPRSHADRVTSSVDRGPGKGDAEVHDNAEQRRSACRP